MGKVVDILYYSCIARRGIHFIYFPPNSNINFLLPSSADVLISHEMSIIIYIAFEGVELNRQQTGMRVSIRSALFRLSAVGVGQASPLFLAVFNVGSIALLKHVLLTVLRIFRIFREFSKLSDKYKTHLTQYKSSHKGSVGV